jgi:hypothetical protein
VLLVVGGLKVLIVIVILVHLILLDSLSGFLEVNVLAARAPSTVDDVIG